MDPEAKSDPERRPVERMGEPADCRPDVTPGPEGPSVADAGCLRSAREGLLLLERVWPRPAESDADLQAAPPAGFSRFRIVRELGRGGFGVVLLAIDPALDRLVALKLPRAEWLLDAPARERFVREARAVAALDHPGIAPLYEAGEFLGVCYMASAYCDGPDLAAWLRSRNDPVDPRAAAGLVAELADALAHAHARGVLHRDLKPSNILLVRRSTGDGLDLADDPARGSPRIVDFGLARLMDGAAEDVTASFAAMGSAPYMAPEQAEGRKVGPAADIYGLGALLYVMLCGRPPHRGQSGVDTLRRVVAEDVTPPRSIRRGLPRDLEMICLKCLEKNPARRYDGAGELRDDLRRFLAGAPTLARSGARWDSARRTWIRTRRIATAAAILAAASAAILAASFRFEDRLRAAREQAAHHANAARESREEQRRTGYIADLRQASTLIEDHRARRAIAILDPHWPGPGEDDPREFAWRYLRRRCDMSQSTLQGFAGAAYSVEYSPSGDLLAAAGADGTVRVWETRSWRSIYTLLADRKEANAAAFSPDGRTLATVGDEGTIRLWDVASGARRFEMPAHRGDAVIARFTPDGHTLITGGRKDGRIALWNSARGEATGTFGCHPANLENAILSPDGKLLVTTGNDRIRLWDFRRRRLIAEGPRGHNPLQAAAFSHDGRTLAVASEGTRRVLLLDVPSLRLRRELIGHTDGVFAVAFSADDRAVFSGGDDHTIRSWDAATGALKGIQHGHTGRIWALALSPDGRTLTSAGGDGTIKLWALTPPGDRDVLALGAAPAAFRMSRDGKRLSALGRDGRYIVRSITDGRILETWDLDRSEGGPAPRRIISGAISDDLRTVAFADAAGAVAAWDGGQPRLLGVTNTAEKTPASVKLSEDGGRALITYPGERVELWQTRPARRLGLASGPYGEGILVPNGRRVVLANDQRDIVAFWDPDRSSDGGPLWNLRLMSGCLAFSTDGRRLACRRWWNPHDIAILDTEHLVRIPCGIHSPTWVCSLACDPSGRTLAAGCEDGRVQIWEIASGEELLTLDGLPGPPHHLQFTEDGQTLAAAVDRADGTTEVVFWRTDRPGE